MKAVTLPTAVFSAVAIALAVTALRQHERLVELQSNTVETPGPAGPVDSPVARPAQGIGTAGRPGALTEEEKRERMRLRGQFQPLATRAAQLTAATNGNAFLTRRLAELRARSNPFPAGYIRRAAAANKGNADPDSTFETLLWAIENRDTNALFSVISAEMRDGLLKNMNDSGTNDFFAGAGAMAGGRIAGRSNIDDATIELQVEIIPGTTNPIPFHREGGRWVLAP
jgi:hypothetical protein